MEYSSLYDMIKYLEYGTKLHIGVVFLGSSGNSKCTLPHRHKIHSGIVCEKFKTEPKEFRRCFMCRNMAINKAVRIGKPFGGLCINGIYEYTRPVIIDDEVVCIIYIGNILTDEGRSKLMQKSVNKNISLETMEDNFDYEKCGEAGALIESYIRILIDKYSAEKQTVNPLVRNIKSYIYENLEYDISIAAMAKLFCYNEVYLGRVFKKETGLTIKEYINKSRIKLSSELLKSGDTVISVAHKVGFNNVTYFNRVFKRYSGKTPSEFRKGI